MNPETISYGLKKTLNRPFDEVDAALRERLKDEGFGVLTEIDVRETLKKKIDVDFRPYRILGACNPHLAHQALGAETDIGLLLPCNLIVYQGDTEGETVVGVLDPEVQLGVTGRSDIAPLAKDVRARMERVLDAL